MSTASFTLEDRGTFTFDDLLAAESNAWASLDSQYDRGLRAGQAQALREHLGVILATAKAYVARHPRDRETILSFVGSLQKVLVNDQEGDEHPFEFDGGLGI